MKASTRLMDYGPCALAWNVEVDMRIWVRRLTRAKCATRQKPD